MHNCKPFPAWQLGMLIFENFISWYENVNSRDSSSTRTRSAEEYAVALTSPPPHPLGINYPSSRGYSSYSTRSRLPVSHWQVNVPWRVSSVCVFVVTCMLYSGDRIFKICILVNLRSMSVDRPVHVHKQRRNCRGLVRRGLHSPWSSSFLLFYQETV